MKYKLYLRHDIYIDKVHYSINLCSGSVHQVFGVNSQRIIVDIRKRKFKDSKRVVIGRNLSLGGVAAFVDGVEYTIVGSTNHKLKAEGFKKIFYVGITNEDIL